MIPLTLPMRGGLILITILTIALTGLAAYGLQQFRRRHTSHDLSVRLQHDLVMMIGMTSVGWLITCVALLLNPTLGADDLTDNPFVVGLYSISRGGLMIVFWQTIGMAAFLCSQLRTMIRPPKERT